MRREVAADAREFGWAQLEYLHGDGRRLRRHSAADSTRCGTAAGWSRRDLGNVTLVCVSFVAGVVYSYGLNPLPYHWETAEVLGHVLMKAWEGGDHHAQMEVIST